MAPDMTARMRRLVLIYADRNRAMSVIFSWYSSIISAIQKCGMDTFISQDGDVKYKLGCVDTNTCNTSSLNTITDGHQYFSCHRCCDDHDLCNARGCNSAGFPVNRGPICFDCEAFPEGYPCHKITHCETHEVCYNDAHLEFQSDVLYSSGCRSKHHCASENVDPMSGIGRRSVSVCTDCCQGDLCNLQCRKSSVCSDDSTCQLLMSNYDVCKSPDIAKQFCKKTCNLCATSGMTSCTDTRLDCAYIGTAVNMCGTLQAAKTYGCLKYCGYCSGTTGGPGYSGYTTSYSSNNNNISHTTSSQNLAFTTSTSTYSTTVPLLHGGDHVVRGPDWMYGNQDGNGTGTVIDAKPGTGWVQVYWYNSQTTQSYRYGDNGRFEVQKYTGPFPSALPTTTTPNIHKTTFAPTTLFVGDKVVRGPDWIWQTQDGNSTGTVIAAPSGGWVVIKWNKTGVENSYRYGTSGKYDVKLYSRGMSTITPATTPRHTATPTTTPRPTTAPTTTPRPTTAPTTTPRPTTAPTTTPRPTTAPTTTPRPTTAPTTTPRPTTAPTTTPRPTTAPTTTPRPTTSPTTTPRPTTTPTTTTTLPTTTQAPQLNVGDVVIRGPDWMWRDQDGNGTGVVTNASQNGWVTVKWNITGVENSYRYSASGKYDIKLYVAGTTLPLTTSTSVRTLNVGDHVIPGPDWRWQGQDGNTTGVVTGASVPGWVTVRWGNGFENSYRYGAGGAHDVEPVNTGYTSGAPPGTASSVTVDVGDLVIRGPDWIYGSQDGNGTGQVIQVDHQSNGTWVKVQWTNGYGNFYRYGAEGKYDVIKETSGITSTLLPTTTTANTYTFKLGDRVVRGPDWQWGNQDNGGVGTVTGVDPTGWVTVRWDNNFENSYRNGVQNARDLQKVGSTVRTTTQKPQITSPPPTAGSSLVSAIYIGARVQRGKNWRYGSQDGNGPGTVRTLPPLVPAGWVEVEWDNGYVNNYRLGKDNAYDIMFVPGSYNPPPSG